MSKLLLLFLSLFALTEESAIEITPNAASAYPKNCQEVLDQGFNVSGTYSIQPDYSPEPFLVHCDMEILNGGWLYIMNRVDGSQNFSLSWNDYKNGFGNIAQEFWLGLEHMHRLTVNELNELLVELVDWDLNIWQFHYKEFAIGSEELEYPIELLGGFDSGLGDSLTPHAGCKFSTYDRDNDQSPESCAASYDGSGWWYNSCFINGSRLTGGYLQKNETTAGLGMCWLKIIEVNPYSPYISCSFKEGRMMIRPQTEHSIPSVQYV